MCGLVAMFSYSPSAPPINETELLRTREAMFKRGPDGYGLWISNDQRVGLAHRRLAIIDLSESGAQPMATSNGKLRIVFNGEIYNYRELRTNLEQKGHRFHSQSDTEVLLHLYQEHDRDMVQYLRGMYAFAIWDEENGGIFLARDPFGVKPLYYTDNGKTIHAASQVKALLNIENIDTTPEPAAYVGFYLWGYVPEPYTLYRGIRCLPAGSTLWVDASGHKETKQVFNLTSELAKAEQTTLTISREDMQERLSKALMETVDHHLVADVPVGLFLSAGLDSATLMALARQVSKTALHTITLGFKEFQGTPNDEGHLAERLARQYRTFHQTSWVQSDDFENDRERLLDAMDQPSIDGVNTYFISKAAAKPGLKVAISGLGGDELFGGYPSFHQIPGIVRAMAPFQSVPYLGRGFCYLSAPILKTFTSSKFAGLLEYGGTYGGAYLLRRGMFMPWELPNLLDGDLVREGWQELQTLSRLEKTCQGINNPHLQITSLEATWYMRNQLLRDADWASMAHSLEVRVPLVDQELYKAVTPLLNSSCPPTKLDMAMVPQHPLPEEILHRKKTGFSIPVRDWLLRSKEPWSRSRGLRGWALTIAKRMGSASVHRVDIYKKARVA
jgi:asparagine synthase (glutamine-hydrolysing)